jgi:hypothetical protein
MTATAPTPEALADDIGTVGTLGLPGTGERSLAALEAVLAAAREADDPSCTMARLLGDAIANANDVHFLRDLGPTFYDLAATGTPRAAREEALARAHAWSGETIRKYRRDWNRAIATKLLVDFQGWRDRAALPVRINAQLRERLQRLSTIAAVQLIAARRPDGSWPGAGTPGEPSGSGNLSATSRSGSALMKVFGTAETLDVLNTTLRWVRGRYREDIYPDPSSRKHYGAFGYEHTPPSFEEGTRPRPRFVANPRDSASGLKILHRAVPEEMPDPRVWQSVQYLVKCKSHDGGWSDSGDRWEPSGVLTTAYVLDALHFVKGSMRYMDRVLPDADVVPTQEAVDSALNTGRELLLSRQYEGGWNDDRDSYYPVPYDTAQVVCFAHQFLAGYPARRDQALQYLAEQLSDGGLPEGPGQPAAIAPTAMAAFGAVRATSRGRGWEDQLTKIVNFLGRVRTSGKVDRLSPYAATFVLLLCWEIRICDADWRDRALGAVKTLHDTRQRGADVPRTVDAVLARLTTYADLGEPLDAILTEAE